MILDVDRKISTTDLFVAEETRAAFNEWLGARGRSPCSQDDWRDLDMRRHIFLRALR
jgi:hypothetical protein